MTTGEELGKPMGMAPWIRNLVMLIATTVWAAYITVSVFRNQPIEIAIWGVPGAVYFALNPRLPRRDRDDH